MSRPQVERRTVGTLLLAQDAAARELRGAFRSAATPVRGRKRIESAAVLIAATSRKMAPVLAGVILERRQLARSSARRRLSAELTSVGLEMPRSAWVVGNRLGVDEARAQRTAESLAEQWRATARLPLEAEETEVSVARDGLRAMRSKLERTARTEVARAYSEEHAEALRDVVEHDRRFRDGALAEEIESNLRRRWSALADACERCFPLDGEEVGIDDSFSGGEVPGWVHPHCCCTEYLVRVA